MLPVNAVFLVLETFLVTITLLYTFIIALLLQALFYAITRWLVQSNAYFDLFGVVSFQICTLVALFGRHHHETYRNLAFRQHLSACMIFLWSFWTGGVLFSRKKYDASQLNKVLNLQQEKSRCLKFIWIHLTGLPVYTILGNPSSFRPKIFWSDYIGFIIWTPGFLFKVVADLQKFRFRVMFPNDFIKSGLWRYSQHPNLFGEIVLWFGVWVCCAAGFTDDWEGVSLASPLYVTVMICSASGMPATDKFRNRRYWVRVDYSYYKEITSKLLPWPPRTDVYLNPQGLQNPFKVNHVIYIYEKHPESLNSDYRQR
jgi:steroid 5-alpha reductase family enzyme